MFYKMYNQKNTEHNKSSGAPPMSPRISFSNDFVESSQYPHSNHHIRAPNYRDAPVSDFEFSVSNYSMMSADELFSKGRLLPLKESCSNSSSNFQKTTTTLRDELLHNDNNNNDDDDSGEGFSLRPPKNPTRWRGLLGLRKSHIGSKKSDKTAVDVQCSKNSQDFVD